MEQHPLDFSRASAVSAASIRCKRYSGNKKRGIYTHTTVAEKLELVHISKNLKGQKAGGHVKW